MQMEDKRTNKALEIFERAPKTHNCAQAVAAGCGREDIVSALEAMGHGRAPKGRCGALHTVLVATEEASHDAICAEFVLAAGSELCRELKQGQVSCATCVEIASDILARHQSLNK